ncbi:MAG TPA: DUF1048 domain-containing protein, partial [Candidatus Saccharibacteria bacterium]|nr:DUF1048 domain-containing protein [Candidatus Saccharibacteria bacterium]
MSKIIDTIIGDLAEKKRYRENEKRAKALPGEYREAYKKIQGYLFSTSGVLTIDPFITLVDMLEEAAAEGKPVLELTGPDVAAFADELVRGEESWQDHQRKKLNEKMGGK